MVPLPEVKANVELGIGNVPPIFSVPPENILRTYDFVPLIVRLPAHTSTQLELAKASVALALPLSIMLAQAPPVTSAVSVTPLTVMASVESGCPPGPEPVVMALQFWFALIVIAAP